MAKKFKGKAWVVGDDIDTDQIYPGKYLPLTDKEEMGKVAMSGVEGFEDFSQRVSKGDILLAGGNFGCGSSREHAPLAIKASGISCVIAKSFARIFFRNAINIGLPLLECAAAVDNTRNGQALEVDIASGRINNMDTGMEFTAEPYPQFMAEIIADGGLIEYTKKRLEK